MRSRWMRRAAAAVVSLTLGACASGGDPASSPAPFCMADISAFSNPAAGAQGNFAANVAFADLALTPNSVGYGAAENRRDEITIADGMLHLARPGAAGGYQQRTQAAAGEGAYMLQLVSPRVWRNAVELGEITSIADLGAAIADAAKANGCSGETKLAYRISVHVVSADWSLDTLPQRGDFTTTYQDALIVGLYASVDQAKHFVTPGPNIHAHIVFPGLGVAGHLKSVHLAPGASLSLQGG